MVKPRIPNIDWDNHLVKGLIFDPLLFEGGNTKVLDLITRVNGVFASAPTWINDLLGMTLKFNGTSDFVEFPGRASISTNVFSIMALVNPTTVAATQFILGPDVNNGIGFRITSAGVLDLIQANVAVVATSTGSVAANVWQLLGVTYNAAGSFVFYNNGVNIGTGTNVKTWAAFKAQIGVERVSSPAFFSGKMTFLKMWNRALSPQEVKELYVKPWQMYVRPKVILSNAGSSAAGSNAFLPILGAS